MRFQQYERRKRAAGSLGDIALVANLVVKPKQKARMLRHPG
jgi:hypothetical protein